MDYRVLRIQARFYSSETCSKHAFQYTKPNNDADEPSKNSNSNIFSMSVYDTPVYEEDILLMLVYDKPVYDKDILSMPMVYDKPVYNEDILLMSESSLPSVKFDDAAEDEGITVDGGVVTEIEGQAEGGVACIACSTNGDLLAIMTGFGVYCTVIGVYCTVIGVYCTAMK